MADTTETTATTKKNMCEVLNLTVAPSRCRSVLTAAYSDADTKKVLSGLKEELKAAKATEEAAQAKVSKSPTPAANKALAAATEKVAAIQTQIADAKEASNAIRISFDSPIACAVIGEWMAKEITAAALDQTIERGMKTAMPADLHAAAAKSDASAAFALVRSLPAFSAWTSSLNAAKAASVAKSVAAAKNAKESDKTAAENAQIAAQVAEESAFKVIGFAKGEKGYKAVKGEDDGVNFFTYIGNATTAVKNENNKYEDLCFSKAYRSYLATLFSQFMQQSAEIWRIAVKTAKTTTLNATNIDFVVRVILMHAGYTGAADRLSALIHEKVEASHEYRSERQAKAKEAKEAKEATTA